MDSGKVQLVTSINCDVCGKKNVTEEICPRCKSDLSMQWSIIRCSEYYVSLARRALIEMDGSRAFEYSSRSWELKRNEQAARCAFLSCCLSGDFQSATKWFKKSKIGCGIAYLPL